MMTYPTGWGGNLVDLDEKSARILLIVISAGNTISYSEAIKRLEKEV